MIDRAALTQVIEQALQGTDLFLVRVQVSGDNVIEVDIDSDSDVTVDHCVAVNDAVHAAFDSDVEDYELTVGSYGITSPLLLPRQYRKFLGGEVEVLTADGRKLHGVLAQADDEQFTITIEQKVKVEGKKRPQLQQVDIPLRYDEIKCTKNIIKV